MRELLRVCLLPALLLNLICDASCREHSGSDGTTRSSISSQTDAVRTSDWTVLTTTTSMTGPLGNATCPGRTANYITHTLPQQCLRTDRVAANATQNTTTTVTSTATATVTSEVDPTVLDPSGSQPPSAPATHAALNSSSTADAATSSTVSPTDTSSSTAAAETESDSPLDNANFLSFEEWKKQNLAKSGQSPENLGQGRNIEGMRERPINNALESFGEEGEIDLDFSGFGGGSSASRPSSKEAQPGVTSVDAPAGELVPTLRSKDAGKTCKERTNYASFDCAANVLKSNPECKSSSSVLVENKDSYMLNTCSANNKFFIVELCDNILIDTVVLANYEFFSSMFRHFRVSVSDRYPVKIEKWKDLGTFEARNVREVQAFLVERPQIWARYLRIEFLSHYGSEYYCPVSLLRVHGTTMLEDYRHQEELSRGDHSEDATLEIEVNATPALPQEAATSSAEAAKETVTPTESSIDVPSPEPNTFSRQAETATSSNPIEPAPTSPTRNASILLPEVQDPAIEGLTCVPQTSPISTKPGGETAAKETGTHAGSNSTAEEDASASTSISTDTANIESTSTAHRSPTDDSAQRGSSMNQTIHTASSSSTPPVNSSSTNQSDQHSTANAGADSSSQQIPTANSSPSPAASSTSATSESVRQPHSSSTLAAPPQPATQESFYKSVHKRLQQLESNSTLSLQYIEEQSRILRDAFSKVEKRQIAATTSFLTNINSTVMAELQGFRQAYDQLWQSTVIELEGQREQYQREMLAMGSRLTLVADELVWQKRMGIVQSTLLLLCLALVLFAKQGSTGYLEMPLMQQMVHRSQTALARAGWESPPASPSPNSRSPVSLFRRKLWRSHTEPVSGGSGNVTDATDSRPESKDGPGPEVVVAPPTPPEEGVDEVAVEVDGDTDDAGETMDEEDEAFEDVWESRSGPATPRGTREGSWEGEVGGVGWLDPGASGGQMEL